MARTHAQEQERKAIRDVWYSDHPPNWIFVVIAGAVACLFFFESIEDQTVVSEATLFYWSLPLTLLTLRLGVGTWWRIINFFRYAFFAAILVSVFTYYLASWLVLLANFYGSAGSTQEEFIPIIQWEDRHNDGDPYAEATVELLGKIGEIAFRAHRSDDVEDRSCLLVKYRKGWLGYAIVEQVEFAEKYHCAP